MAVFPELGLSGYSIDDLFLQDTLLDGVRRAIDAIVSASVDLLPVLVVGAPLARGNRVYNCAVVIHRGEVLGVAPKSYLPNYREFYERRWFAPGRRHPRRVHRGQRRRGAVRARPDLPRHRRARASTCTSRSARTCGSRSRRARRRPSPGATVLANLSGSPITVGRAEDRRLLVRSASARCSAAYVYRGRGPGRVDHRPQLGRPDDGLRVRRPARRGGALPRERGAHRRRRRPRPAAPGAAAAGHLRRQPAGRGGDRRSASSSSTSSRRAATSGCGARSTASPSCPTTPSGSRSTATRPTTSRSPASSSASTPSARPRRSSASAVASTRPTP